MAICLRQSYELVIPSRERATWLARQHYSAAEQTGPLRPTIVIRNDDSQVEAYENYARATGAVLRHFDSHGILGIAGTYNLLINSAIMRGYKRLIILDDDIDLRMYNLVIGDSPMYIRCNERALRGFFQHAVDLVCPQMPMLTFPTMIKRTQGALITFCKPMRVLHVYYLPHFAEHLDHRFNVESEAYCDFNLTLRLLTQGFVTGYMNSIIVNHIGTKGPGGCSIYRDVECNNRSVEYLKQQYPEIVKTHLAKGWFGGRFVMRSVPSVRWKESLNHEAFTQHFGENPTDFSIRMILNYERTYAAFIEELRSEAI